ERCFPPSSKAPKISSESRIEWNIWRPAKRNASATAAAILPGTESVPCCIGSCRARTATISVGCPRPASASNRWRRREESIHESSCAEPYFEWHTARNSGLLRWNDDDHDQRQNRKEQTQNPPHKGAASFRSCDDSAHNCGDDAADRDKNSLDATQDKSRGLGLALRGYQ